MNAIDMLKYGHQSIVDAVDGLSESEWDIPGVCGVWSAKEIVAHLASYEVVLVEILQSFIDNSPTPTVEKFMTDELFNDGEVAKRKHHPARDVWNEYDEMQAKAVALMAMIPVEGRRVTGTLPWYGDDYDLEDFIVYTFYGHKREHSAQIFAAVDQMVQKEEML